MRKIYASNQNGLLLTVFGSDNGNRAEIGIMIVFKFQNSKMLQEIKDLLMEEIFRNI